MKKLLLVLLLLGASIFTACTASEASAQQAQGQVHPELYTTEWVDCLSYSVAQHVNNSNTILLNIHIDGASVMMFPVLIPVEQRQGNVYEASVRKVGTLSELLMYVDEGIEPPTPFCDEILYMLLDYLFYFFFY